MIWNEFFVACFNVNIFPEKLNHENSYEITAFESKCIANSDLPNKGLCGLFEVV
jgi:hypothetical protein